MLIILEFIKSFKGVVLLVILCLFTMIGWLLHTNHQIKQKSDHLQRQVSRVERDFENYQAESIRQNKIVATVEQQQNDAKKASKLTQNSINMAHANNFCFSTVAPTCVIERLRQQAHSLDSLKKTTTS